MYKTLLTSNLALIAILVMGVQAHAGDIVVVMGSGSATLTKDQVANVYLGRNNSLKPMVSSCSATPYGLPSGVRLERSYRGQGATTELPRSPWMRGAPQSGFSTLIRRIISRSSAPICGRPPGGLDFQRQ